MAGNTCSVTKMQQVQKFEELLGFKLPQCADLFATDTGLMAIEIGPDNEAKFAKAVIFEPNQNGKVDVYKKIDRDVPVYLGQIVSKNFKPLRSLILFARELDTRKLKLPDELTQGYARVERIISEKSPDGTRTTQGIRHHNLEATLSQRGVCESDEDVARQVHANLMRLCYGKEFQGYMNLSDSSLDKKVCKSGRYNVDTKAACMDYTTTYSSSCVTATYRTERPTIEYKTTCTKADCRTDRKTQKK